MNLEVFKECDSCKQCAYFCHNSYIILIITIILWLNSKEYSKLCLYKLTLQVIMFPSTILRCNCNRDIVLIQSEIMFVSKCMWDRISAQLCRHSISASHIWNNSLTLIFRLKTSSQIYLLMDNANIPFLLFPIKVTLKTYEFVLLCSPGVVYCSLGSGNDSSYTAIMHFSYTTNQAMHYVLQLV